MPELSRPELLIGRQPYDKLAMPRRGEWQSLSGRYVETFIGPSLLSKDEHLLNLVVQVLTKIGLRGGNVSEQVSKFVAKAFGDFIPEAASPILIGFQFKFCLVEPHQVYTAMIDGFVGMFGALRRSLDGIIGSQLKLMWTNDVTFDRQVFNPYRRVFDIFRDTLDDVVLKKKEKEDIGVISGLAKRILPALEGDGPPGLQFIPLTLLRGRLELLSSDGLSGALAADPGEEAAALLVDFLLSVRVEAFEGGIPPFVDAVFRKNDKHLTADLLRRLADLPAGLAAIGAIHRLLRAPIQNALEANRAEAEGLLPLLWKCANVDEFEGRQPIAFQHKTAAAGLPRRAAPAPRAPPAAAFGSRAAAFSGFTCSDVGLERVHVMQERLSRSHSPRAHGTSTRRSALIPIPPVRTTTRPPSSVRPRPRRRSAVPSGGWRPRVKQRNLKLPQLKR
jgi:hypothetical protein